ncbi:PolC-type DNA polymerase III [Roseateles saccharophilus]|uniref:DNA polymerase-3 subunit epsilon n=1 Tax=Roseateles saccharophilus TaxID=304 RepID=A0A4R3UJR1_ROSSA|nr:3'-5' exonuclease [Roseateles saccharophilus]MDG0834295.1 3'-5' exonuclease [Roseateles saccharophilus]TCU91906.1 DNA polymerase-3 subunit epsilon [Roseateles saccharophilus]
METIAVIDFETTGLAPTGGGRATEIAAVLVSGGQVVDRFSSLMRTGAWVPPQIQALTGISNEMLAGAPDAADVMCELARFTAGCPLVAHNAGFDRGFWQAEMRRAGLAPDPAHDFACTVLLTRRLWPEASSHSLGEQVRFHGLSYSGRAHRALADALVTAELLLKVQDEIARRFALDLGGMAVDHALAQAWPGRACEDAEGEAGLLRGRLIAGRPEKILSRGRRAGLGKDNPALSCPAYCSRRIPCP